MKATGHAQGDPHLSPKPATYARTNPIKSAGVVPASHDIEEVILLVLGEVTSGHVGTFKDMKQ
eukprot:4790739-Alexandrium_andersonii.AAC.1